MSDQQSQDGMFVEMLNEASERATNMAQMGIYLYLAILQRRQTETQQKQLDVEKDQLDVQQDQRNIALKDIPPPTPPVSDELGVSQTVRDQQQLDENRFQLAIAEDGTHVGIHTQAGEIDGLIIDGGIKDGRINVAVDASNDNYNILRNSADAVVIENDRHAILSYEADAVAIKDDLGFPPRDLASGSAEYATVEQMGPGAVARYEALRNQEQAHIADGKNWWTQAGAEGPRQFTPDGRVDPDATYNATETRQDTQDGLGDKANNPHNPGPRPANITSQLDTANKRLAKGAYTDIGVKAGHTNNWAAKTKTAHKAKVRAQRQTNQPATRRRNATPPKPGVTR